MRDLHASVNENSSTQIQDDMCSIACNCVSVSFNDVSRASLDVAADSGIDIARVPPMSISSSAFCFHDVSRASLDVAVNVSGYDAIIDHSRAPHVNNLNSVSVIGGALQIHMLGMTLDVSSTLSTY
jgi:hypothetical protein